MVSGGGVFQGVSVLAHSVDFFTISWSIDKRAMLMHLTCLKRFGLD